MTANHGTPRMCSDCKRDPAVMLRDGYWYCEYCGVYDPESLAEWEQEKRDKAAMKGDDESEARR